MSGDDVQGSQGSQGEAAEVPQAAADAETEAERDAAADAAQAGSAARAGSAAQAAADAAAEAAAAARAAEATGAAGDLADAPAVAIPDRLLETPEIPGVSDSLLGELDGGVDAPFPQRRRRRRDAIEAAIEAAAPVGAAHPGQLPDDSAPAPTAAALSGAEQSGYGGLAALIFGGLGVLLVGAVIAVVWLASGLG